MVIFFRSWDTMNYEDFGKNQILYGSNGLLDL